ncbi:alpha carbonic anhydrase 7-like [Alnus glutinosa]|uniref:alpha carbonic anhydrase 7-like n=1 Tax=Alnus glutinosa TaxID=3517 RepID=UPI002D76A37E|nr:alpha carbonic anhydrase 7-like [Alnus glutinosa]
MKNPSKPAAFVSSLLIFVLVFSYLTSTTAEHEEDEREFEYKEGSEKGPGHWGEIRKEWAPCKNGGMQSPIDLSSGRVKIIEKLGELKRSYKSCNATLHNRGHDISVQWIGDRAGSIQINGTDYFLKQGHWHSPSEHSINGRRYDLELHMVHETKDLKKLAVVGLLYKIGQPDAFLSKLMKKVVAMTDKKEYRRMGMINPAEIKMGGKKYYRYMGSLTIPPCTEGVIWTINKLIRTVSKEQVKLLREAVHDYAETNSRPVQQVNQREIHLYGPNP